MSPLARSGGRYHRIENIGYGFYRLSWAYEVKHGRLLGYRTITRDTDEAGALRFSKKWGVPMPERKRT